MSPAGPLSVTLRFAESTASTEAVICATRSATPLPGAVAVIVAPRAARSTGCACSADGARLAAARISVQTLLRIRISMSGGTSVVSLKLALKALLDTYPGWGKDPLAFMRRSAAPWWARAAACSSGAATCPRTPAPAQCRARAAATRARARRGAPLPRCPRSSGDGHALLGCKDPLDQRLEVGIGDIVRRHRNCAPDAAAPALDLLLQPDERAGIAGVLGRDLLVGRSEDFLVQGMAGLAAILGGQGRRISGADAGCRCAKQREGCCANCEIHSHDHSPDCLGEACVESAARHIPRIGGGTLCWSARERRCPLRGIKKFSAEGHNPERPLTHRQELQHEQDRSGLHGASPRPGGRQAHLWRGRRLVERLHRFPAASEIHRVDSRSP